LSALVHNLLLPPRESWWLGFACAVALKTCVWWLAIGAALRWTSAGRRARATGWTVCAAAPLAIAAMQLLLPLVPVHLAGSARAWPATIPTVLATVWAAGAAIAGARLAAEALRVCSRVAAGTRLRAYDGIEVREVASDPAAPYAFGWRRPVIALPPAWRTWSRGTLRAVLRHEAEHVRRGDPAVELVLAALAAVAWFLPPVRMAAGRARHERELACDRAAASEVGPGRYAEALIQVARGALQQRELAGRSAMAGGFERRLAEIHEHPAPRARLLPWVAALFAIGAALAIVPLAACGERAVRSQVSMDWHQSEAQR